MKLFGLLRKPDWEHKDPAVRLRALQSSQDPALLARIAEFAQSDPDPKVRAAALRRVDDAGLLERRLRGELDAAVAAVARERLGERLCQAQLDVASAQAVLLHVHDADVLTRVAERSPHAELRRTALERIERPGFHLQRCLQDPDPAVRFWLLQRIDALDALQKIADGARKTDKRLARAARERIDERRLAAGDADTLRRLALALCERFGRLGRELPDDRALQLAALDAEWQALRPRLETGLQVRGDGARAMADAAIRAAAGEPVARARPAEPAPVDAPLPAAAPEPQPDPALEALIATLPEPLAADFEQAADALWRRAAQHPDSDNPAVRDQLLRLREGLDARRRQHAEHAAAARSLVEEAARRQLDALDQAVQAGSLAQAQAARAAIDAATLPRSLHKRLQAGEASIAKLERWQRWSSQQARRRLCEEAEALEGRALHPDALVTRIKELQAEWARLDALDGGNGEDGLARRFRALCHRLVAPARPYFEKRRELRGERAGQIEALLRDSADAAADGHLRKQLREALAALDEVAPEKRQSLGRQLRERLATLDASLAAQREQAALGKRKLIARLRRDLGTAEPVAAVALAKAAQQEWKALPRSGRDTEDALWQELRTLVDPLFARQREAVDAAREQQQAQQADALQLIGELDALAGQPERLLHADAALEQLQARWRALVADTEPARAPERGPRERKPRPVRNAHPLEPRFEAALAAVHDARAAALAAREREQWQRIGEAGALLDRLAAATATERDALETAFAALDLPADARQPLAVRLQAIQQAQPADAAAVAQQARLLAVRAELVAGLDSPTDEADLRRQLQMQRLAARLEGRADAGLDSLRGLLIELQALHGLAPALRQALQPRILAALARMAG